MTKKLWFKRKIYGWGWYPCSWQGWAITAIYIGLVILFSLTIDESSKTSEAAFTFLLPVTFLTVTFIRIAYKTGEEPKWQWGSKAGKTWMWLIGVVAILGVIGIYFMGEFQKSNTTEQINDEQVTNTVTDIKNTHFPESKYFDSTDWPPSVEISSNSYSCNSGGRTNVLPGTTYEEDIDDKTFCITETKEGAAGSMYTTYTYKYAYNTSETKSLTFTVREVQCQNYDEPEATNCANEQSSLNIDLLVSNYTESM